MSTPQNSIFVEGTRAQYVLEYSLADGVDPQPAAASLAQLAQQTGPAEMVVAFGPALWSRLNMGPSASDLRDFKPIGAGDHAAPASQRDVLVWIHGAEHDDCFDRALAVEDALSGVASAELDLRGFVYHDSRDLTGFIDGSANPKDDARLDAAVDPETGGSVVFTQRWVHDLDKFNTLAVPEQERVIGRTKADSVELEGDAMPPDSHVSRTDISGTKIYRRSFPYGSVGEKGLYFLAFGRDMERFEVLLRHMFGVTDDGIHDRLIEFSKPVTGGYWFAPSAKGLKALAAG